MAAEVVQAKICRHVATYVHATWCMRMHVHVCVHVCAHMRAYVCV